ncbi:MAG: chemotaxis protein CheX [Bacteriovorax sp.]|nr:chemotaxis protein CheX [Bacteriovorax sp.]
MKKLEITEQIINELQESVNETFYAVLAEKMVVASKTRMDKLESISEITSQVSLFQENLEAILIICLDKQTLLYIANKVFGSNKTEIDDAVKSCINEFSNMIFGVLKTKLTKYGYKFKMSIPSLITGTHEFSANIKNGETYQIKFLLTVPERVVTVNLCLTN